MKIAVIAITINGSRLANYLSDIFDGILYLPEKFYGEYPKAYPIKGKLKNHVGDIFNIYDAIIFIMATGIVVRSIAPFIKDKKTDPAIVVLDEKGKNIISLLSGHLGGANKLTMEIADKLSANPVITTASDVNATLAIDMFAKSLGATIENEKDLTSISASIVNGEKVGFYSDYEDIFKLPDNIEKIYKIDEIDQSYKGIVFLTHRTGVKCSAPHIYIRPKSIVLGIGCRKGKEKHDILEAITAYLHQLSVSASCIKRIATVDVKKEEQGLIQTAEHLGVPLVIVDRPSIQEVEHRFECSSFVKETIGVGCVAEPCAFLSCDDGYLLDDKYKKAGITIVVGVEKKLIL